MYIYIYICICIYYALEKTNIRFSKKKYVFIYIHICVYKCDYIYDLVYVMYIYLSVCSTYIYIFIGSRIEVPDVR